MQIRTIRKGFEVFTTKFQAFKCKFEQFERIQNILTLIRTIWKGVEALECKVEPFKRALKHLKATVNQSKEIRGIRMQTLTIQKGF